MAARPPALRGSSGSRRCHRSAHGRCAGCGVPCSAAGGVCAVTFEGPVLGRFRGGLGAGDLGCLSELCQMLGGDQGAGADLEVTQAALA